MYTSSFYCSVELRFPGINCKLFYCEYLHSCSWNFNLAFFNIDFSSDWKNLIMGFTLNLYRNGKDSTIFRLCTNSKLASVESIFDLSLNGKFLLDIVQIMKKAFDISMNQFQVAFKWKYYKVHSIPSWISWNIFPVFLNGVSFYCFLQ